MTDTTTTTGTTGATEGPRTSKGVPREVDYSLEIVDELPQGALGGGTVGTPSILESQIETIVRQYQEGIGVGEDGIGKWRRIALYRVQTAAAAAANVLRKRHGSGEHHKGFLFRTAPVEVEPGVKKTGLFVRYNPNAIVDGEYAKHLAKVKDDEQKAKERTAARKAAAAGGTAGGTTASDTAAQAGTGSQDASGASAATSTPPAPAPAPTSTQAASPAGRPANVPSPGNPPAPGKPAPTPQSQQKTA